VPVFGYHLVEQANSRRISPSCATTATRLDTTGSSIFWTVGQSLARSVMLTFDGARNFYDVAFPLLKIRSESRRVHRSGLHAEAEIPDVAARP
jgi:hypothetical protein